MAYPSTPWTLRGYALPTLQLIELEQVRPLIPSQLEIVSVLPGKTLGGVYVSFYDSSSVLQYSELIVVAALVRHAQQWGSWISHIYVDDADSVAGGREIWGLPKELAEFSWEKSNNGYQQCVTVSQRERTLCRLSYNQPGMSLPVPFSFSHFSVIRSDLFSFQAEVKSRLGLIDAQLVVPQGSPFGRLGLNQPRLTLSANQLRVVTHAPKLVASG